MQPASYRAILSDGLSLTSLSELHALRLSRALPFFLSRLPLSFPSYCLVYLELFTLHNHTDMQPLSKNPQTLWLCLTAVPSSM